MEAGSIVIMKDHRWTKGNHEMQSVKALCTRTGMVSHITPHGLELSSLEAGRMRIVCVCVCVLAFIFPLPAGSPQGM